MLEWDSLINEVKGYRKMNKVKERFVAEQINDLAKYRKSALVLVEYERYEGILSIIRGEE